MSYPFIQAKSVSYGGTRTLTSVRFIVIHYTGNNGDTAKGNCKYFATGNTRSAGAHFFVSQDGSACQSIDLSRVAYSVGDRKYSGTSGASYYGICKNANSVSIELCDNAKKYPSATQTAAVKELVKYIQSKCPNAQTIIRHWDVSGKSCPALMTGVSSSVWKQFKSAISGTSQTTQNVTEKPQTSGALAVDGIIGPATIRQWQRVLGTVIDGYISGQSSGLKKYHLSFASSSIRYGSGGSSLVRAIQKVLGCEVDGQLGPQTIKAIQKHLHQKEDGYLGPVTAEAIQRQLSYGVF